MDRINKLYMLIGLAVAFGFFFEITAHAAEIDEATTITFSAPVDVPGQVLPAGAYLFKLANDGSNPNVVQIFNSEGTKLYATLDTIPTEVEEPMNNTTITLAKQGSRTPDALVKWFYPGSLTGHEFMYSAREEKNLAQVKQQTIVLNPNKTGSEAQAGE